MIVTFLPVSEDGYLYGKDRDIRRYTPCIVLSNNELKTLKRLYAAARKNQPCPIIGEMLKHPLRLEKDYGSDLRNGSIVVYLYENISPKARSIIRRKGGVLNAYSDGISDMMIGIISHLTDPDGMLFREEFKKDLGLFKELVDAGDIYCKMVFMLDA